MPAVIATPDVLGNMGISADGVGSGGSITLNAASGVVAVNGGSLNLSASSSQGAGGSIVVMAGGNDGFGTSIGLGSVNISGASGGTFMLISMDTAEAATEIGNITGTASGALDAAASVGIATLGALSTGTIDLRNIAQFTGSGASGGNLFMSSGTSITHDGVTNVNGSKSLT
jgi:hypothetical protein